MERADQLWCLAHIRSYFIRGDDATVGFPPGPRGHVFFVVTMRHPRRHGVASGFGVARSNPFNNRLEAILSRVRGSSGSHQQRVRYLG